MSEIRPSTEDHDQPTRYEIRIKGHLDDRWAAWFDGLTITREDNGETLLAGPVVDQAALHGLLKAVRDLGTPLLSVIHHPVALRHTLIRASMRAQIRMPSLAFLTLWWCSPWPRLVTGSSRHS